MSEICNQVMLNDDVRDTRYLGTAHCLECGEESHFGEKFPVPLEQFTGFLKSFSKLHTVKGCNDKESINREPKLKPDWYKIVTSIKMDDKLAAKKLKFMGTLLVQDDVGHIVPDNLVKWCQEVGLDPKLHCEDKTSWWSCTLNK